MNSMVEENIEGNRVVKAFVREPYETEKFDKHNDDYAGLCESCLQRWNLGLIKHRDFGHMELCGLLPSCDIHYGYFFV